MSAATRAPAPQPRLARVAAAIGDPARAAMLSRLLDGRYHTATELAKQAGVAASTASQHLRILIDAHVVRMMPRGRHRYFTLADGNVAQALEALLRVADSAAPQALAWQRPDLQRLRHARSCFGHLAGVLGVGLCECFLQEGYVEHASEGAGYAVTPGGAAKLESWGVPLQKALARGPGRVLYGCVDWSERRDHFAGPLAVAILETLIDSGWLRRQEGSRELHVTPIGWTELQSLVANTVPFVG